MVVLNHFFLASLASLSTFIQHHETTAASDRFRNGIEKIWENMEQVVQCLQNNQCDYKESNPENNSFFDELLPVFNATEIPELKSNDIETLQYFQESHLVWQQLHWLFSISSKMLKLASSVAVREG